MPKAYARLSDNDREAVVLEAYYALSKTNRDGTSNNTINGKYYGDWNYIASDIKSYELVKSKLRRFTGREGALLPGGGGTRPAFFFFELNAA